MKKYNKEEYNKLYEALGPVEYTYEWMDKLYTLIRYICHNIEEYKGDDDWDYCFRGCIHDLLCNIGNYCYRLKNNHELFNYYVKERKVELYSAIHICKLLYEDKPFDWAWTLYTGCMTLGKEPRPIRIKKIIKEDNYKVRFCYTKKDLDSMLARAADLDKPGSFWEGRINEVKEFIEEYGKPYPESLYDELDELVKLMP